MEDNKDKGAWIGDRLARLPIHVTEEIIATALPANSGHCMISDAVKLAATVKGMRVSKVLTDLQTIRFTDLKHKRRFVCFTPRVGQLALLAFDQGVKPEPFSFRLKPVQVIDKTSKGKRARATSARKRGERPMKHGGPALPTTVGLRREFGLRQMGVYKTPEEHETARSA